MASFTPEDSYFMELALDQASLSLKNGWIPVGAVFVKDSRIVTLGTKSGASHTLFDHAEHNACYQALWSREGPKNLAGCTVYSTLEPCLMCLSMLMTTRVARIVYALSDPYGGGTRILTRPELLPPRFRDERPTAEGGILEERSKTLLRKFFESGANRKHWSDPENPLIQLVMS